MSAVFLAAGAIAGFSAITFAARDCAQSRRTRTPLVLAAVATVLLAACAVTGGAL